MQRDVSNFSKTIAKQCAGRDTPGVKPEASWLNIWDNECYHTSQQMKFLPTQHVYTKWHEAQLFTKAWYLTTAEQRHNMSSINSNGHN